MPLVEFFWDVGSPYTYLAATQLEALAERTGAEIRWRPFLLGGVFKAAGNHMPAAVPAKARYMGQDLERWARHYQVPYRFSRFFPINSLLPMRAAVVADTEGEGAAFGLALMTAYWAEGKNASLPEVVAEVATQVGLDGVAMLAGTQDPAIKEALKRNTQAAIDRGAFGAPAFFLGDDLYWGNDRLVLLEERLRRGG